MPDLFHTAWCDAISFPSGTVWCQIFSIGIRDTPWLYGVLLRRRLVRESGYGSLSVDVQPLFETVFLESHKNGLELFFSLFSHLLLQASLLLAPFPIPYLLFNGREFRVLSLRSSYSLEPPRKGCMIRDLGGGGLVEFGAGGFHFSTRFSSSHGNSYHCHSVRSSLLSGEI